MTNDFATVEATHDSEELKSAMQNAGVVGASTIWRAFFMSVYAVSAKSPLQQLTFPPAAKSWQGNDNLRAKRRARLRLRVLTSEIWLLLSSSDRF